MGFGRGMLGLVCKPVAGTIDLVTYTARGIGNTPRTMYVGLTKLIRKRKIKRKKIVYSYPPIMPYIPTEGEMAEREKQAKANKIAVPENLNKESELDESDSNSSSKYGDDDSDGSNPDEEDEIIVA